jgi:hypothetical protein
VDSVKHWLKRGRREASGDYAAFVAAVEGARREPLSTDELLRLLEQAAMQRGSVQAAMFLLRRLDRERRAAVGGQDDRFAELDAALISDLAARRRAKEAKR